MKRLPVPRWLLVVVAILPAVLAVGIFAFIARIQLAHDESRCPFREVETREVGADLRVREDARQCLPEIEEPRWLVLRAGADPLELGRFPLEADQVAQGFPWSVEIEEGRAVITVVNEGRGELVFREPGPEAERTAR